MRVYLSGPITGHTKDEIESWRNEARSLLLPFAEIIDPARSYYNRLEAFEKKESASDAIKRIRHGRLVVDRNKELLRNCDVLLANLVGARSRASIGTVGEICWANVYGKPIVLIREKHGNVHDHAMLNAIATQICHDLRTACDELANMANISEKISTHG